MASSLVLRCLVSLERALIFLNTSFLNRSCKTFENPKTQFQTRPLYGLREFKFNLRLAKLNRTPREAERLEHRPFEELLLCEGYDGVGRSDRLDLALVLTQMVGDLAVDVLHLGKIADVHAVHLLVGAARLSQVYKQRLNHIFSENLFVAR